MVLYIAIGFAVHLLLLLLFLLLLELSVDLGVALLLVPIESFDELLDVWYTVPAAVVPRHDLLVGNFHFCEACCVFFEEQGVSSSSIVTAGW
jgi:hypothetical protein